MDQQSADTKPVQPANPYNIDFERERRLKRTFQMLIGATLALAFLLIFAGYAMDAFVAGRTPAIVPATPYGTPAPAVNAPQNKL